MFYVLSPFEWLTGWASWALPFGVEVLNAVTAGAAVAVAQAVIGHRGLAGGPHTAAPSAGADMGRWPPVRSPPSRFWLTA